MFQSFTQSTGTLANKYLKEHSWNVERAVDAYFMDGHSAAGSGSGARKKTPSASKSSLTTLFDKYKDSEEPDVILVEGTELLCQDLQVDPTDRVVLSLAWHLKCEAMCEFKRQGWMDGWSELQCDTLDKMRSALQTTMINDFENDETFKEIYLFSFNFAKPPNQKSLPLETAIAFWELLLNGKYKHLDLWTTYLQEKYGKSISKDTWSLFLDFIDSCDDEFKEYDEDGAWPVVIDSFVEYARQHLNV